LAGNKNFFIMNEYLLMWRRALDFKGRSRRKEYWMPFLVNFIIGIGLMVLAGITKSSIFFGIYSLYTLAMILPATAMAVRRLHDVGRSGWFYLIIFVPFGAFYLLYLFCQDSERGVNRWGEDPKKNER